MVPTDPECKINKSKVRRNTCRGWIFGPYRWSNSCTLAHWRTGNFPLCPLPYPLGSGPCCGDVPKLTVPPVCIIIALSLYWNAATFEWKWIWVLVVAHVTCQFAIFAFSLKFQHHLTHIHRWKSVLRVFLRLFVLGRQICQGRLSRSPRHLFNSLIYVPICKMIQMISWFWDNAVSRKRHSAAIIPDSLSKSAMFCQVNSSTVALPRKGSVLIKS